MPAIESGPYQSLDGDKQITVSNSGYYIVRATQGVCSQTSEPIAVEIAGEDRLTIPNVFTPDERDTVNTTFITKGNVRTELAVIVNRWGDEVYKATTIDWHGTNQPPGIYYWTVLYRTCDDEQKRARGFVQLIR